MKRFLWLVVITIMLTLGVYASAIQAGSSQYQSTQKKKVYIKSKLALEKLSKESPSEGMRKASSELLYLFDKEIIKKSESIHAESASDRKDRDLTNSFNDCLYWARFFAFRSGTTSYADLEKNCSSGHLREPTGGKIGSTTGTQYSPSIIDLQNRIIDKFIEEVQKDNISFDSSAFQCLGDRGKCVKTGESRLICAGLMAICLTSD